MRDEKAKYKALRIGVEGPDGAALGINVNDDHDRLELRSTLSVGRFEDILVPFRKALKTKTVKSAHTGSGVAEGTTTTIERWWNKNSGALLGLIGLLSISGIVGVYRAFFRHTNCKSFVQ